MRLHGAQTSLRCGFFDIAVGLLDDYSSKWGEGLPPAERDTALLGRAPAERLPLHVTRVAAALAQAGSDPDDFTAWELVRGGANELLGMCRHEAGGLDPEQACEARMALAQALDALAGEA